MAVHGCKSPLYAVYMCLYPFFHIFIHQNDGVGLQGNGVEGVAAAKVSQFIVHIFSHLTKQHSQLFDTVGSALVDIITRMAAHAAAQFQPVSYIFAPRHSMELL